MYRDPDVVRAEEYVEDSIVAKETHTATKMLNKFRQMEENLAKEPAPMGVYMEFYFLPGLSIGSLVYVGICFFFNRAKTFEKVYSST